MRNLKFFAFVVLAFLAVSCGNEENSSKKEQGSDNLTLLTSKAEYSVEIKVDEKDFPCLNGFDSKTFVQKIMEKVMSGEITVYSYFFNEKMTVDDVKFAFGAVNDTTWVVNDQTGNSEQMVIEGEINNDEIKELVFIEEWYFDEEKLEIEKKVKEIGLVRYYYKDSDLEMTDLKKTVVFMVKLDDIKEKV